MSPSESLAACFLRKLGVRVRVRVRVRVGVRVKVRVSVGLCATLP